MHTPPSTPPEPSTPKAPKKDPWRHADTVATAIAAVIAFGGTSVILAAVLFGAIKVIIYVVGTFN